jgi:DNA repair exonuclease SbcCD nuclease subunit
MKAIEETDAKICFAHLELAGFEMQRGNVHKEGMDKSIFDKFDIVLSGHYHHKSTDGKIHYLGNPTEHDWSDCDDPKGFHIFDDETYELEFIRTPFTLYKKFVYDDVNNKDAIQEVLNTKAKDFTEKFVKIIVNKKQDMYLFTKLVDTITEANPHDLSTVENATLFLLDSAKGTESEASESSASLDVTQDTLEFIHSSVDSGAFADGIKPERIKKDLTQLYKEAVEIRAAL